MKVLLDVDNPAKCAKTLYRMTELWDESSELAQLVRGIASQIEEYVSTPPRIPEPSLWGVVEAGVKQHGTRLKWVRLDGEWAPDDDGEYARYWEELIDPVLIREGI